VGERDKSCRCDGDVGGLPRRVLRRPEDVPVFTRKRLGRSRGRRDEAARKRAAFKVREDESDEGVGTRRPVVRRGKKGCAMKEQGGMCGPRSLGSRLLVQAASAVR
jgi:hypothetical protein